MYFRNKLNERYAISTYFLDNNSILPFALIVVHFTIKLLHQCTLDMPKLTFVMPAHLSMDTVSFRLFVASKTTHNPKQMFVETPSHLQ